MPAKARRFNPPAKSVPLGLPTIGFCDEEKANRKPFTFVPGRREAVDGQCLLEFYGNSRHKAEVVFLTARCGFTVVHVPGSDAETNFLGQSGFQSHFKR